MTPEPEATPAHAYQAYFGPAIFEPLAEVLLEHAAPRPGERVLDLACGTGIVARAAARRVGAGGRVVGVDLNPGMIAVARTIPAPESAPIEWREGDAIDLDLPGDTFDLALIQQGLQFFPDRAAGLAQVRRVLVDGGRLALAVWEGLDRHPLYEALTAAELPHLRASGLPVTHEDLATPFSLGDPDELRALLSDAGFRDISIIPRSIEARYATPDRFVERMEYAYAAVVPQFVEDPAAFAAYVDEVARDARDVVERYRQGNELVATMHTHIAVAHT